MNFLGVYFLCVIRFDFSHVSHDLPHVSHDLSHVSHDVGIVFFPKRHEILLFLAGIVPHF